MTCLDTTTARDATLASTRSSICIVGTSTQQKKISDACHDVLLRAYEDFATDCILSVPWFQEQQVFFDFERTYVHFGRQIRETIYWSNLPDASTKKRLTADELNVLQRYLELFITPEVQAPEQPNIIFD